MSDARVIVCGGRDFSDAESLNRILDSWIRAVPTERIIVGGAPGADTLAAEWAASRFVDYVVEPADWEQDGRAAGPLRNQRMIDRYAPTHCIAFPGGRGTADMIRRATRHGLNLVTVGVGNGE